MTKGVKQLGSHEERLTDKVWKFSRLVHLWFSEEFVLYSIVYNQDILSFSLFRIFVLDLWKGTLQKQSFPPGIYRYIYIWLELKLGRCLGQIMMPKSIRCFPSLYEILLGTTSSGLLVHVYIAHKKHVDKHDFLCWSYKYNFSYVTIAGQRWWSYPGRQLV